MPARSKSSRGRVRGRQSRAASRRAGRARLRPAGAAALSGHFCPLCSVSLKAPAKSGRECSNRVARRRVALWPVGCTPAAAPMASAAGTRAAAIAPAEHMEGGWRLLLNCDRIRAPPPAPPPCAVPAVCRDRMARDRAVHGGGVLRCCCVGCAMGKVGRHTHVLLTCVVSGEKPAAGAGRSSAPRHPSTLCQDNHGRGPRQSMRMSRLAVL